MCLYGHLHVHDHGVPYIALLISVLAVFYYSFNLTVQINIVALQTEFLHFMQATLILSTFPKELVGDPMAEDRLYDAVNVILSYQVRFF
jgi:hypothetical protein